MTPRSQISGETQTANRPGSSEYAPRIERYVGRVPDGDIRDTRTSRFTESGGVVGGIDENKATRRDVPPERYT